ncbi:hypothetical protein VTN02DRAFT_1486 [Thermoascus thermophilus]
MVDQGLRSWTREMLKRSWITSSRGGFRTEESGRKEPSVSGLGLVMCTMTQQVSGYVPVPYAAGPATVANHRISSPLDQLHHVLQALASQTACSAAC